VFFFLGFFWNYSFPFSTVDFLSSLFSFLEYGLRNLPLLFQVHLKLKLISPEIYGSLTAYLSAQVWLNMTVTQLSNFSYYGNSVINLRLAVIVFIGFFRSGDLAGLGYHLDLTRDSIILTVSGYSDKIGLFLSRILPSLTYTVSFTNPFLIS